MPNWIGLLKRYVWQLSAGGVENANAHTPITSQGSFDFIHARNIAQGIGKWKELIGQAYT